MRQMDATRTALALSAATGQTVLLVTLRGVDLSLGVDEHDDGLVLVPLSRRIDGVLQSFATFFVEGDDTFPVDGETADPLLLVA